MRAANERVASANEMSGPMPAGSPELTTINGGDWLTFGDGRAAAGDAGAAGPL